MPKIDRTVTREYIMNNTPWDPPPDQLYYLPDRIFNCRNGIVEVWATETDPPTLTGTVQFPSFDITCVAAGAKPIGLRWPLDPGHPNYGVTGKPQYEEDYASTGGYLYLGTEGYGVYVLNMSDIYQNRYDDFSYYWRLDTQVNPLRSDYVYDISTAPYTQYLENYCVVSDGDVDVCTYTGTEYWDPDAWDEDNEEFGMWISTIAQFFAYTETPHAYRCFQTSSGTFYYSERSFCKMDPAYINPIESTYEAESVPIEAFADFEYFRLVVLDPPTPEDNYQVKLYFYPFPFSQTDHVTSTYTAFGQCYSTYIVDEFGTPLYYFLSEKCYISAGNPLTVTVKVRYANTKKLYFLYKWPTTRTSYYFGSNNPDDVFEFFDTFRPNYFDTDKWTLYRTPDTSIGNSTLNSSYASALLINGGYQYIQTKNKFKPGQLEITYSYAKNYVQPLVDFLYGHGWVDSNSDPIFLHYKTGVSGVAAFNPSFPTIPGNPWETESWMQKGTEGVVIHHDDRYDLYRIYYETPTDTRRWPEEIMTFAPGVQRISYTEYSSRYFRTSFDDLNETEGYLRIFCGNLNIYYYCQSVALSKANVIDPVAYIGPEIPTSEYFKSRLVAVYEPTQNWVWTDLNDITGHVYTDTTFLAEDIHDFFVTENTSQHPGENVLFVATENGAVIIEENRSDHENLKLKYYFRDKEQSVDKYIIYDYTTDFPYFDIHLWSDGTLAKTASEYAGYYSFDYNGRPPANRVIPTVMEPDEGNPIAFDIKPYIQTYEMDVFADIFDGGYWTLVMQGFSGSQIDYKDSRWKTASTLSVPNLQSSVAAKYPAFDKIPFSNVYIKAIMGGQDFSLKFSLKSAVSMSDLFAPNFHTNLATPPDCWTIYTDPDADYDYWITVLREAGVPDAALPPNDPYYYRANAVTSYSINGVLTSEIIEITPTYKREFPLFCRLGFFGYNPTTNGYVSCGIANGHPGNLQNYWYHSGIIYNLNDGYETVKSFTSWWLYIQ